MGNIEIRICGNGIEMRLLEMYSTGSELPDNYDELKKELLKITTGFPGEKITTIHSNGTRMAYINGEVGVDFTD